MTTADAIILYRNDVLTLRFAALYVLRQDRDFQSSMRDLSTTLGVSPGTLSDAAKVWEANGLVTVTRPHTDRRVATIRMTERGVRVTDLFDASVQVSDMVTE